MARFITADTHFGHPNILISCKKTRGHFTDVDEMNNTIIENWNSKVGGEDTIHHLGDISVKMSNEALFNLLSQLHGKIIFVKGNHDDQSALNWLERNNYSYANGQKFSFHEVGLIISENKKEYYLSHYPMELGYQTAKRRNFHGHIHGRMVSRESCLNVGIDSPEIGTRPFGEPVHWNDAIHLLEEKRERLLGDNL